MLSLLIVGLTGDAKTLGIHHIPSVTALARDDVEFTISVSRSVVVDFIARVGVLVGALVALRLVSKFVGVGGQLTEAILNLIELAAIG